MVLKMVLMVALVVRALLRVCGNGGDYGADVGVVLLMLVSVDAGHDDGVTSDKSSKVIHLMCFARQKRFI